MASGWRVVSQRGTEDLLNSRFVQVMEVMVETDDGTPKTFRIPMAQYTAASVEATVNEWYERHQAVAGL